MRASATGARTPRRWPTCFWRPAPKYGKRGAVRPELLGLPAWCVGPLPAPPKALATLPHDGPFGERAKLLQDITSDGEVPVFVGVRERLSEPLIDLRRDSVLVQDTVLLPQLANHPF